jgi:predicted permease
MLLTFLFVLLGAASGFAIYRLGSQSRRGRAQSPALRRLATILAFGWFALSALLIGWAAWRFAA